MSGGKPSRVIITALSAPPAVPNSSVSTTASGSGTWASRQSAPSTTAASPIIEPTDRSMPPVMMTGVSASASSPTSTPSRATSNALAAPRKLRPVTPKIAHSTSTTASSAHSPFGNSRSRSGGAPPPGSASGGAGATDEADMVLQSRDDGVGDERREDDGALHALLPERADADVGERRADRAQQHDAQERA